MQNISQMIRNKSFISYTILLLAAVIQLLVFLQNRSLFYDEINLARNFIEKPYSQLFSGLDYDQHAPPFFSQIVKFCVDIFGKNEYALRLFPFLAGLGSLFLFYKIARKFLLQPLPLYFSLTLFSFSIYLLEYTTEVKQYAVDVLLSCLLMYLTLNYKHHNRRPLFLVGVVGAFGLWFSMPVVFTLVGVGFYLLLERHSEVKNYNLKEYKVILGIICIWVISFALLFFINLKPSLASSHLQSYHTKFFLKLPFSIVDAQQTGEILIGIIRSIVGKTTLPIVFGVLFFFGGLVHLIKQDFNKATLLISPILVCFLASFLHFYSLIIRLTLFLFPAIIIIMGIGFALIYKYIKKHSDLKRYIFNSILFFGCILCLAGRSSLPYLIKPFLKENSRDILMQRSLSSHQTAPIYITHFGEPSYKFYTELYHQPISSLSEAKIYGKWNDDIKKLAINWRYKGYEKIWIFDGHAHGEELKKLRSDILKIGKIEEEYQGIYSFAILIKLKDIE